MPSLKCPHCSRVLKVGETAAGKRISCPACHKAFLAPKPPGEKGPAPPTPPPVPSAQRPWHLHIDGRNAGPFSAEAVAEHLKAGKVNGETLAWQDGMADWKPLRQLPDFRSALRGTGHGGKADEAEHERRRRYVPGRSKRDAIVGAWVAVVLAAVLVGIILYVRSRPGVETPTDPYEHRLATIRSSAQAAAARPAPQPSTTAPAATPAQPKKPKIIRKKKPKLSNERLLANVARDVGAGFKRAFANPEKADVKPIFRLRTQCRKLAGELRGRQWGNHQREVGNLADMLEQTAGGIDAQLKLLSQKWHADVGYDPKQMAKDFTKDLAFLKRWQTHVDGAIAALRKRGLEL
jgi:DNA-directed RNA polymerase subunit RPC12/RpoP